MNKVDQAIKLLVSYGFERSEASDTLNRGASLLVRLHSLHGSALTIEEALQREADAAIVRFSRVDSEIVS